ncbi:hypothetical protein GGX14DRAFT_376118 [Mycena pura]|uniref:Uncharacterized protein n=1 Tax=Mycena pura TaxID=153505 RepID=A0AAD6Y6I9_9AGAR|nr:hypothetical protein GGX14DRAFT_376118 [Mycena pura]
MDVDPPRSPTPPPFRPNGRPNRRIRPTQKIRDSLPEPPKPVQLHQPTRELELAPQPEQQPTPPRRWVKTTPNVHGVYKVYPRAPTHDPDASQTLRDLCQTSEIQSADAAVGTTDDVPWYSPFPNPTTAELMSWYILTNNHAARPSINSLVHDVIRRKEEESTFNVDDLASFDIDREIEHLDKIPVTPPGAPSNGWLRGSVKLKLPCPKHRVPEADAPELIIDNVFHRPLLDVMREAFEGPMFERFHTTPHSARWDRAHDPAASDLDLDPVPEPVPDDNGLPPLPPGHEDIFGELYTSAAYLGAYAKLPHVDDGVECIIAAFMFWSDATHLANFGTASLWPLYTFFGNQSKYERCKPTTNSGFHQAYFPSVCQFSVVMGVINIHSASGFSPGRVPQSVRWPKHA